LAQAVGDLWAVGRIPVAAEHLASEVIVHALKGGLRNRGAGPLVAASCLPGERHEWGVLTSLTVLQDRGWRIQYLGADLPVGDMLEAAWKLRPAVVALSASDARIVAANLPPLLALPGKLPPGTAAVVGGRGMTAHASALRARGYGIGFDAFTTGTGLR
ncbi:MAG: cobalamin B12-binding domain-containing protein, partial [Gemmatimonadales bacterium]|nr:cobalamin B12-binding domain-containing protein [Gemmatimonadales bacterium]